MEQLLQFIANHPILTGAFAVVLAALIATEVGRMARRWREIDTHQAIRLINDQDPLILDVSNSSDYSAGHILNAEHLPPSRIEAGNQKLLKQVERPVLLYCKNGQVSPQMATRLTQLGFKQVYVLAGGLNQWLSDSQPLSRGRVKTGRDAGSRRPPGEKKTARRERRRAEPAVGADEHAD